MVSDYDFYIIVAISQFVLILVLMEYGLWRINMDQRGSSGVTS